MFEGDACCPKCVEVWVTADPAEYLNVPQSTDLRISCTSLVTPTVVNWFYSSDEGATWTEIERAGVSRLDYNIKDITSENDGRIV